MGQPIFKKVKIAIIERQEDDPCRFLAWWKGRGCSRCQGVCRGTVQVIVWHLLGDICGYDLHESVDNDDIALLLRLMMMLRFRLVQEQAQECQGK